MFEILLEHIDLHELPSPSMSVLIDAMLFYVRDNKIYMRVQRNRHEIKYVTPAVGKNIDLRSCGMTVNNRFKVLYRYDKTEEI